MPCSPASRRVADRKKVVLRRGAGSHRGRKRPVEGGAHWTPGAGAGVHRDPRQSHRPPCASGTGRGRSMWPPPRGTGRWTRVCQGHQRMCGGGGGAGGVRRGRRRRGDQRRGWGLRAFPGGPPRGTPPPSTPPSGSACIRTIIPSPPRGLRAAVNGLIRARSRASDRAWHELDPATRRHTGVGTMPPGAGPILPAPCSTRIWEGGRPSWWRAGRWRGPPPSSTDPPPGSMR